MILNRPILSLAILILVVVIFWLERFLLHKKSQAIPLRICVAGTRGKSSITRLITGCLQESGLKVLAKTTGSLPALILPDGKEKVISRDGTPNILEGKKVLRSAVNLKVHALVTELMSIHPENLKIESTRIFRPHILVITNMLPDHQEQIGYTRESICRSYSYAVPRKGTVFMLEETVCSQIKRRAEKFGSIIRSIPKKNESERQSFLEKMPGYEFEDNLRLTLAVADFLGIEEEIAWRGILKAIPDYGGLKVWSVGSPEISNRNLLVSAFAANDPESTKKVFLKLKDFGLLKGKKVLGLLNLREDRGDRTLQWFHALSDNLFNELDHLLVTGLHAHALKRKLKGKTKLKINILPKGDPDKLLTGVLAHEKNDMVLVGMGNMQGIGSDFVNLWEKIGDRYDL